MLRPVVRPSADTPAMRLALDRAAAKYTLEVVIALQCGPQRFSELRSATGASSQGLTRALRAMERDGLLVRTEHPAALSRVDYELSTLGTSLCDVVTNLREWAEANGEAVSQARENYDRHGSDQERP